MNDEPSKYQHAEITNKIIQSFYQVYNQIGIGFEKEVYVNSLFLAAKNLELVVNKNQILGIEFSGEKVGQMSADLIIENKVLVQVFNDKKIDSFSEQKTYNQLKNSKLKVGLILNFGVNPEFKRKEIF